MESARPCPRLARGLFIFAVCGSAAAAPWVPADEALVLERLPPGAPAPGPAPSDATAAAALARAHIERARATDDPRFLGYAEGALRPWWSAPAPPAAIRVLRATLLQSRHRFDEALRDLDAVLAAHPDDAQARLTRATILRVRGRAGAAAADCAALAGRATDFVAQLCLASARGLAGALPEAAAALDALAPANGAQPAGVRAWFFAEYAEMAERLGDDAAALARYRDALAAGVADSLLRAAAADLLLRLGQPAEALAIAGAAPAADVLRLRTVLAARALGRPRATLEASLASGWSAAQARGEDIHLREEARFALDISRDAARALALARRNWAAQREPADTLLLARAAQAAADAGALAELRRWRRETGFQDARLPP
jgi:hypothetical protein